MFCDNCGKEIEDGIAFCPYCGASFGAPEEGDGQEAYTQEAYVQEAYAQPESAAQPAYAGAAPEEKRSGIGGLILFLFEAAAVVLLVLLLFKLGQFYFGPKALVRSYVKAVALEDWNRVFGLMDTDNLEELSGQDLVEEIRGSFPESFDDFTIGEPRISGETASVPVSFLSDGVSANSVELSLKRVGKELLLFDTWRVTMEDNTVRYVIVTVPHGAEAYVDGKKLTEKGEESEAKEEPDGETEEEEINDSYVSNTYAEQISALDTFKSEPLTKEEHTFYAVLGGHTIDMEKKEIKKRAQSVKLDLFRPSMEFQREMITQAYEFYQAQLHAQMTGKSFDTIQDIFVDDAAKRQNAREYYDRTKDSFYASDGDYGYKSIDIREGAGWIIEYRWEDGNIFANVGLEGICDYTYPGWGDNAPDEVYTDGYFSENVALRYDPKDGTWLAESIQEY